MKLVGERRALASIIFAFYFMVYVLMVMMGFVPPEMTKAYVALAGVYGLAFFSLVAGYFWARWYSVGLGLYGVIVAIVGLWQLRNAPEFPDVQPVLLFIGGTHLAATLMLWGDAMSGPYDGQTAWRQKLHMDENAVQRLGRSVIRAGVSLPLVLLYALVPRPKMMIGVLAVVLAVAGFRGLIKLKTWGVVALGVAGGILVTQTGGYVMSSGISTTAVLPALAGVLLIAAAIPFVPSMVRYFRSV